MNQEAISIDRFLKVRELVRDPTLRIKDIAAQTGYDKGHVSRLRKEAKQKEWHGLTDKDIDECYFAARVPDFDVWAFAEEIENCLKEKNT